MLRRVVTMTMGAWRVNHSAERRALDCRFIDIRRHETQQLCRAERVGLDAPLQPPRQATERPQINAKEQTRPRSRERALNNTFCLAVTSGADGSAATRA
jgi:hypothetical protein